MALPAFLNHNLDELTELKLLNNQSCVWLTQLNFHGAFDILTCFKQNKSFLSLTGCDEMLDAELKIFSERYLQKEKQKLIVQDVFSPAFQKNETFFVPFKIDWNELEEFKIKFLDAWIKYSIDWYQDTDTKEFFQNRIGNTIDAKTFYDVAILQPLSNATNFNTTENHAALLTYQRSTFLKFYEAITILEDPFDILKFFARYEFFIEPDHKVYAEIKNLTKNNLFPYAYAVNSLVENSKYFNHPRGFQDLNKVRFVKIFNSDPYTFGILNQLFNMKEENFLALQNETNTFAEKWCKATIAVLKALGFKENYRQYRGWNEQQISSAIVSSINYSEKLYLPAGFYALLFEEVYDIKF